MGVLDRLARLVRSWTAGPLGTVEDPDQVIESSVEKQLVALQDAKRSIVDVTTARRRLELQVAQRREDATALEEQARHALAGGHEDLARAALQRKHLVLGQADDLRKEIAALEEEEQRLQAAEARLSGEVEGFRTRAQLLRARHSAASAQVRIGEAITGLSNETAEVGLALQRAEERTRQLQARADALEEMMAEGLLEAPGGADVVSRQLQHVAARESAESDLAALKQQLGEARGQAATEEQH